MPLRKDKSWKLVYQDTTYGKGNDLLEERRKRDGNTGLNCTILERFYSEIKTRKRKEEKSIAI